MSFFTIYHPRLRRIYHRKYFSLRLIYGSKLGPRIGESIKDNLAVPWTHAYHAYETSVGTASLWCCLTYIYIYISCSSENRPNSIDYETPMMMQQNVLNKRIAFLCYIFQEWNTTTTLIKALGLQNTIENYSNISDYKTRKLICHVHLYSFGYSFHTLDDVEFMPVFKSTSST